MSNVSKGQIQLPDEFRPGEPIRAGEMDKLRQAIAFALKDMIGGGRGITVSHSAGRYLISARKQRSSSTNLTGFTLKFSNSDPSEFFISNSDILAEYNPGEPDNHENWSIKLPVFEGNVNITIVEDVDGNLVSEEPEFDDGTLLYGRIDGSGDETDDIDADNPQTFCRIPVIRDGKKVSFGGFYREGIRCENGEPIVEFYQI